MDKNKELDQKKSVKKWVCVEITHRYNKTQHVITLKNYLKNMFKNEQILFLGNNLDNQNFNNAMDGYFFIQCNDIQKYIETFRQSKYINNILINFDQIVYIDDAQVQSMISNFYDNNKNRKNEFRFGDIVRVKKGMFKNLYGIVIQAKNDLQILTCFKFISGYRLQIMTVDNCQYENNLFDVVRVGLYEL